MFGFQIPLLLLPSYIQLLGHYVDIELWMNMNGYENM